MNMEIKVLGTGCAGCKALCETVRQAVAESGLDATVVKEEDIVKIMSYDVMTLPALVVDGRVVAQGRKLSLAEVHEKIIVVCGGRRVCRLRARACGKNRCRQAAGRLCRSALFPRGKTLRDLHGD